jgi:hypothetical protein
MECSQVKTILYEYADTEIPVQFREDVEAHLAACKSCSMQSEALKEQLHALRALPKVEAPGNFLEQVRSRMEKPSALTRLKQRFSGPFAGRHFVRLAGAAATAAIVIVAAQVLVRGGGQKALFTPAPPSVETHPSAVPPPSVEAPAAPAARPESLPDSLRGSEKSMDEATAARNRPMLSAETQSVSLILKLPGVSARGKSRGGAFKAESFSAAGSAAETGAPAQRSRNHLMSKGVTGSAEPPDSSPRPAAQKISSSVVQLIKRADGKILSPKPAQDENQPETLLAEIPSANYPSFISQLRELGEVEPGGDKEFTPAPGAKVRVSVRFEAGD